MSKILLDYFFPIASIDPTPAASTAFLKQACVVVKPKSMVTTGVITACSTMAAVSALTDNTEAQQLFNAGMDKVYILPMNDLELATALDSVSLFYTVLISSDFSAADITETKSTGTVTVTSYANLVATTPDTLEVAGVVFTAQSSAVTLGGATFQAATSNNATAASIAAQINGHATASAKVSAVALNAVVTVTSKLDGSLGNVLTLVYTDNHSDVGITVSGATLSGGDGMFLGSYSGVVGVSATDDSFLTAQAAIPNRAAFHTTSGNGAKNMFYAFGKMLSNQLNWRNQQYISMPVADDVSTLGAATTLFDDKVSFVISDSEFGNRLALFAEGGKAIVAPYIKKNLEVDFQSAALTYISGNQPQYTKKQAALLEDELKKVIQSYIDREWLENATVAVTLVNSNFVASAEMNIAEPKAMWRILGEMRQTL